MGSPMSTKDKNSDNVAGVSSSESLLSSSVISTQRQCNDATYYVVSLQGDPSPRFYKNVVKAPFFERAKRSGSLQPYDHLSQTTWDAIKKNAEDYVVFPNEIDRFDRDSWFQTIKQAIDATYPVSNVDRLLGAPLQEFRGVLSSGLHNLVQPEITNPLADEVCLFAVRMALTPPQAFAGQFSVDEKGQGVLANSPMTTCWMACVDAMGPLFSLGQSSFLADFASNETAEPPAVSASTSSGASTDLPDGVPPPPKVPTVPTSISSTSTALPRAVPPPPENNSTTLARRLTFHIQARNRVVTPYWEKTSKAFMNPRLRRRFEKDLDSDLADEAVLLVCESKQGTTETMPSAESITEIEWADAFRLACDDGERRITKKFHKTMCQLALLMAQTRPSSFRDEFTPFSTGDDDAGSLSSTLATRQWMGARILFGSPWHFDPDGSHQMQIIPMEGAYQFNEKKDPTEFWVEACGRDEKLLPERQFVFDPARNAKDKEDSERLHTIMTGIYIGPTAENYKNVFQDVLKPEPVFEDAWKYLQVATSLAIRMALTHPRVFKEECCQNPEGRRTSWLNPTVHTMQWMGAHEAFGCPWRVPRSTALKVPQEESLSPPDKPKFPTSPNTPQINFVAADEVSSLLDSNHLSVVADGTTTPTWHTAQKFLSELNATPTFDVNQPVHIDRQLIFDVNRGVDLQLATRMRQVYSNKLKLPSNEQGHALSWRGLFHDIFDNSDVVPDKYPNLTSGDFHDMKVLAATMANTPPSFFPRFFTQTSQELDGYLIRTYFTEQWLGAKQAFGAPWYKSHTSPKVDEGLRWVRVSLVPSTTTRTWIASRELTECKDLVGFTLNELLDSKAHNVARLCLSKAVSRAGQEEQGDYILGNWLYAFETAFLEDQRFLSEKEAKLFREFACRLALTPPWLFDDFFVKSPTDDEQQGFLGYVTHPPSVAWLAARELLGCPWNLIIRPECSLELLASVAESMIGGLENSEADGIDAHTLDEGYEEVLATADPATRNNLLIIANTFAPAASDFLKVVVAGVIAAKLDETELLDFLMPHTKKQLDEWLAKDKVSFPSVGDLESERIEEGYLALKGVKTAAARNAANQLGVPVGAALPGYKTFLAFLRRCRQTFSDMRLMNADMDKDNVKCLVYGTFKGAKTLGKFTATMDDLKKKYIKARSNRKYTEKRKKKEHEEQRKTKEEKARQEEELDKEYDEEGENPNADSSKTTDDSGSQLGPPESEEDSPSPTENDDNQRNSPPPSESRRLTRSSSRELLSSRQNSNSNKTPTRSSLRKLPLSGQNSNKTPSSHPRGRDSKKRPNPANNDKKSNKKAKRSGSAL